MLDSIPFILNELSLKDLCYLCVYDVLTQTLSNIVILLVVCSLIPLFSRFRPCISISLSLLFLFRWLGLFALKVTLLFLILSFTLVYVSRSLFSCSPFSRALPCVLVSMFCLAFEHFFAPLKNDEWKSVRGVIMLLLMKVTSFSFKENPSTKFPSFFSYALECVDSLEYFLNPASLFYGPWISFERHHYFIKTRSFDNKLHLFKIIFYKLFLSLSFLSISNCFVYWIFPPGYNNWLDAYIAALSFRTSHYFISYLSESLSVAYYGLDIKNCDLSEVELPRSLSCVAYHWNYFMSSWLKTYTFVPLRQYGVFISLFFTYLSSSLLHGMNFRISAILLSLCVFAYIEFILRENLSLLFNCCIRSKRCASKQCSHARKYFHPLTMSINISFSLLSLFHLAYLGCPFSINDESDDSDGAFDDEDVYYEHDNINATRDTSLNSTLYEWEKLGYKCHFIAIIQLFLVFFTNFFLKIKRVSKKIH